MNVSLMRIFLLHCMFSLMAVGGANVLLPELHRHVVDLNGWMSSTEFASLYAIAQAAPGPNVLIVSLIGWKLRGIPGALVATIGMCGPSSVLTYGVSLLWDRFKASPWRRAIEQGLAPITIGLVLGSGCLLARAADLTFAAYAVTAVTAVVAYRSRFNPLWLLAAGAALGLTGLL